MKLHTDPRGPGHRVTSYGEGFVVVDEEPVLGDVVVTPEVLIRDWAAPEAARLATEIAGLLDRLQPEILLLGTGDDHVFPDAEVFEACASRGIGIEVMTTAAACRTYNILMAEGRVVAAVLLATGT